MVGSAIAPTIQMNKFRFETFPCNFLFIYSKWSEANDDERKHGFFVGNGMFYVVPSFFLHSIGIIYTFILLAYTTITMLIIIRENYAHTAYYGYYYCSKWRSHTEYWNVFIIAVKLLLVLQCDKTCARKLNFSTSFFPSSFLCCHSDDLNKLVCQSLTKKKKTIAIEQNEKLTQTI